MEVGLRTDLTAADIDDYRRNGFVVIDDFLAPEELEVWRIAFDNAVANRKGIKIPGRSAKTGEDDGINAVDVAYFGGVFDQLINLWQTDAALGALISDPRIGEMASRLSGCSGIRIWHDQALIKQPWGNPTTLHLDLPYWSFEDKNALSIWIALDDATYQNGCLYFLPGTHHQTNIEEASIGPNMKAIFDLYPDLASVSPVAAPLKAGSASFHNGLCIHGAGANMTTAPRRAMTCAFMPDGSRYNGKANVLPESYRQTLAIGDLLDDDRHNPLIYKLPDHETAR